MENRRKMMKALFEDPSPEEGHSAPLGNFFGDVLLTLLYRTDSDDASVLSLADIKASLHTVADEQQPRYVRAEAALDLGRFVSRRQPESRYSPGMSSPTEWFHHALKLGSVKAAWELATLFLREQNLRVEFDIEVDLLPRLSFIAENRSRSSEP